MNIQEIRQKYPQYSDLSDEQLAKGLHDKFYADMPYEQFSQKIGLKQETTTAAKIGNFIMNEVPKGPANLIVKGAGYALDNINQGIESASRWLGEGAQERATNAGFSPEVAGVIGTVAHMAPQAVSLAIGPQSVEAAASKIKQVTPALAKVFRKEEPQMVGMGSATTAESALRQERAAQLPVPMKLTKGQASRDFEQLKFEKEGAKAGKEGAPLREKQAELNEKLLLNFDTIADTVGAESPTLTATGKVVDQALKERFNAAKARVKAAYTKADQAGDTAEKVTPDALVQWLDKNSPAEINATVITSAKQSLIKNGGAAVDQNGNLIAQPISLKDLEEVRKLVRKVSGKDATNSSFGKEAVQVIDSITEGKGGDLYKQARALRSKLGREFEDHAVISKMLRTKPGTTDRAVAYEDVFNHSILSGSLEDTQNIGRLLKRSGPQGQRAWRELQGETVKWIKEQATKGTARDIKDNPIVNAGNLNRAITSLDREGKLDYLFGKKGAQVLRDINDVSRDVVSAPPGAVNFSNTASTLLEAMGEQLAKGASDSVLPSWASKTLFQAKAAMKSRQFKKRVEEAINP